MMHDNYYIDIAYELTKVGHYQLSNSTCRSSLLTSIKEEINQCRFQELQHDTAVCKGAQDGIQRRYHKSSAISIPALFNLIQTSATLYEFRECIARRHDWGRGCLRRLVGHKALHRPLQAATVDRAMDIAIEQPIQSDLEDEHCCQKRLLSPSNDMSPIDQDAPQCKRGEAL